MIRKTRLAFALLYITSLVGTIAAFPAASALSISPSAYYGPPASSAFTYGTNTTYLYTYNFSARNHDSSARTKDLWIPSLNNRTVLDSSGIIYQQEFKILREDISPYTNMSRIIDPNGNYIYYFKFHIPISGTWSLGIKANLTLRTVTWKQVSGITMSSYNKSDAFYTLYTKNESQISKYYPAIASKAAALNTSNPYATVKNVYDFVTSYLTYNGNLTGDYGAEFAITNGYGDCTEFSYLMTALLRACGIPARVLRGMVIARSSLQGVTPDFKAPVGTSWAFTAAYDNTSVLPNNLTGHAWCEYFIPGQGWITADPTWHAADNYTAKIDNVHVPYMTNLWIGDGIVPALPTNASTNPTNAITDIPYPMYNDDPIRYDIRYAFTVIQQTQVCDIWCQILQNWLLVLGIVAIVVVIIIIIYAASKRKSKSKESAYH